MIGNFRGILGKNTSSDILNNITEIEIPYLPRDFNLTDGHAYRKWSKDEEKIIDRSPEFFKNINRQMQPTLEKEYVTNFLTLGKQTLDFNAHHYLQCTNASMGIEMIANYLRLNKLSLTLIEPCFDNLADVFKRQDVFPVPFSDEHFESELFKEQLKKIKTDAVCLVSPNNPTGNMLTEDNFKALVTYCKEKKKLLIMDFCFRAYLPDKMIYDQYKILIDSEIDYI